MTKIRPVILLFFGAALLLGPVSATAGSREAHDDITITRDGQFDAAHGVRSGHGTMMDPYVIADWTVWNLSISDTTKAVRIERSAISNLTLNWIGHNVLVRTNTIGDMRVNENVTRWGAPTAGIIRDNTFSSVSQIRHFDGRFVHNTVGTPDHSLMPFFHGSAVNFDGFNGAEFAYNTIYGSVDAQLHGHHHSSGYGRQSHMHASESAADKQVDHATRWHEVMITNNHIIVDDDAPYALAYLDTNHAGNDRTAPSETNPNLNAPHVHHTRVHLMDNVLDGGGIMVNVFNATDDLHKKFAWGEMMITGNTITMHRGTAYPFTGWSVGINIQNARNVRMAIDRNVVTGVAAQTGNQALRGMEVTGSGVSLNQIDEALVTITNLTVSHMTSGVQASQMTKSVRWQIKGLKSSDVDTPVSYDSSVQNSPRT